MQDQFGDSLTSVVNDLFDLVVGIDRVYNTMTGLINDATIMAQYATPEVNQRAHEELLNMIDRLEEMISKVTDEFNNAAIDLEELSGVIVMGRELPLVKEELLKVNGRIPHEKYKEIEQRIEEAEQRIDDLNYRGMQKTLFEIHDDLKSPQLTQALEEAQAKREHHVVK